MDGLKLYMNRRHVRRELQDKVKRWSNYVWTRNNGLDDLSCLDILPARIRAEIAIQIHLETLRKVKIFEDCEEDLLCDLVLKLKPQTYSPGDYICKTGEIGREMYIITHGLVEVSVRSSLKGETHRESVVVATLQAGNYFGEISLLNLASGQKRTADVRSVGYSELLVLSRQDLVSALVEYPNAKRILETCALERIKSNTSTKLKRRKTLDNGDISFIFSEPIQRSIYKSVSYDQQMAERINNATVEEKGLPKIYVTNSETKLNTLC